MEAINVFGVGAAMIGLAGISVAAQACREVLAMPRFGQEAIDWPVLAAMIFTMLVDFLIVIIGVGIAVSDVGMMGGAHV